MVQILTGTSGYSFRDWSGTVYPGELSPQDWLNWYSQHLSLVELNFTFYRMPDKQALSKLQSRVPRGFRFSVKAHRSLTHDRADSWKENATHLRQALQPMIDSGSLVSTLFQFPYSFKYSIENRRYLADLLEVCENTRPAVEFRHTDWIRTRVLDGLTERNAAIVCPDLPPLRNLPRFRPRATSSIGYLRLHGRNTEHWWTGTNESRYYYRYSDSELHNIADNALTIADEVDTIVIAFNNHFAGNAFHNALQLQTILDSKC